MIIPFTKVALVWSGVIQINWVCLNPKGHHKDHKSYCQCQKYSWKPEAPWLRDAASVSLTLGVTSCVKAANCRLPNQSRLTGRYLRAQHTRLSSHTELAKWRAATTAKPDPAYGLSYPQLFMERIRPQIAVRVFFPYFSIAPSCGLTHPPFLWLMFIYFPSSAKAKLTERITYNLKVYIPFVRKDRKNLKLQICRQFNSF